MKIFKLKYLLAFAAILAMATSCKKDHYIDGGVHSGKLDMNIYEFLQSRPFEFDTIVQILDRTGLAAEVQKPGVTFFAPKDLCIVNYLKRKSGMALKDVPDAELRAAMAKYIIPATLIWRDEVPFFNGPNGGGQMFKSFAGDTVWVDAPLRQDYNGVKEAGPKFIRIWFGNGFANTWTRRFDAASTFPETKEVVNNVTRYYNPWVNSGNVITSDLQATNGNIQVLNGTHTFNFPYK
ncbi:hypothetical protein ACFOTA_15750 [Chitinophaga sp. GCM10012297]|uniref:Fasciclin domain-containing protein n=1 Tax=Chitinophaga chungangae TaxID=2821488 RepID=A0ABS3YG73_9BACT|nr:hypothetical protein [Chitinophaga chungangae]MBO9153675.1 hypothetical protein [Chitinophaga chungangae]